MAPAAAFLRGILVFLSLAVASLAAAAERYENARFGYSVPLPENFGPPREADNGDGITVRSPHGNAVLLVYGFHPVSATFAAEVASAIAGERERGWDVSYRAAGARAASWSGSKAGRIVYVRAIALCDGAIGTFRLEYDGASKAAFDPVIGAMVKGFRASPCR